ncbi:hypothetical protein HDV05_005846 [Chytridiales sp. JEL 0842]|nr:hypothetical protein HDV05_005846 [Chytridiales sp. JEL 0842]
MAADLVELSTKDIIHMLGKLDPSAHYSIEVELGQVPECQFSRVPRSSEVGRLICFVGTVIRTGMVKMMETRKMFDCTTCQRRFAVGLEREQYNTIPKPFKCLAPPVDDQESCQGKKFKEVRMDAGDMPDACKDYQEIKVQEHVTKLAIGTIPRAITVVLEDDLVDLCKAGDDVTVVGTVIRRWKPLMISERADIEIIIIANHVKVNNEQRSNGLLTDELKAEFQNLWAAFENDRMLARNLIVKSFCPKIVGMYVVKLAIMLILVGGVAKYDKSGMKMRGDGHLLLVGDPGTGKSQFLRYAARISPRSVLTTGIGSTNAGLTVTAVKDSGEWQLEAGALVLADRGLCCIDEFGSIKEQDKTAIHEAMEQQAGLVCKLNTRCSILAATNPKGKYDPHQNLEVNIALASPLLSRFDLVLILLDSQNMDWDKKVSSFILGLETAESELQKQYGADASLWNLDKLQAYVTFVKSTCNPKLTEESNLILKRYYQAQRSSDLRNAARTTIRLLESLIRLAQSHARLMFQEEVTVTAVMLVEISMQTSNLAGVQSTLHAPFPVDAEREYLEQETRILHRLGLTHLSTAGAQRASNPSDSDSPNGTPQHPQTEYPIRPRSNNVLQRPTSSGSGSSSSNTNVSPASSPVEFVRHSNKRPQRSEGDDLVGYAIQKGLSLAKEPPKKTRKLISNEYSDDDDEDEVGLVVTKRKSVPAQTARGENNLNFSRDGPRLNILAHVSQKNNDSPTQANQDNDDSDSQHSQASLIARQRRRFVEEEEEEEEEEGRKTRNQEAARREKKTSSPTEAAQSQTSTANRLSKFAFKGLNTSLNTTHTSNNTAPKPSTHAKTNSSASRQDHFTQKADFVSGYPGAGNGGGKVFSTVANGSNNTTNASTNGLFFKGLSKLKSVSKGAGGGGATGGGGGAGVGASSTSVNNKSIYFGGEPNSNVNTSTLSLQPPSAPPPPRFFAAPDKQGCSSTNVSSVGGLVTAEPPPLPPPPTAAGTTLFESFDMAMDPLGDLDALDKIWDA